MAWTVVLAKDAAKELDKLPSDRRDLLLKHLGEMRDDPFRGDVKPLKGKEWKWRLLITYPNSNSHATINHFPARR